MKDERQHSDPVWERLRRNRDENTPLFTEAHIRPELAGKVICPACGAEESVLFWSVVGRKKKRLYLLCPICEEARVRFNLASNQAVDPVFTRTTVGGGMGMIAVIATVGLLFYFRDTEPVQMLAERLYETREAVAGGAQEAGGRLIDGDGSPSAGSSSGGSSASGGSAPRPAPRAGGPAPSGGGSRSGAGGGSGSNRAPQAAPEPTGVGAVLWGGARSDAAAGLVYRASGDRREELDRYAAQIIERRGEAESLLLREVRYDPQRDETLVVVDSASTEWPRRLGRLRGWRRLNE